VDQRTKTAAGVVVLAAGVVAAAGARRAGRAWRAAEDTCSPDQLLLPIGEERKVETDDGAVLAVTIAGSGPTVVLAHCWTGSRQVWAPVAHRLVASGHRVVLYDQRAHGESTSGADGFTVPRLGADLRAVLDALDVRDAVLSGHSMGGMTIQSLALHHPEALRDRCRGVVLVATAASGLGTGAMDAVAARIVSSRALERAMRSRAGHALVRGAVGRSPRHGHLATTRDLFVACPPDARGGFLTAMQAMDVREGHAAIAVPTTVVVGTHDRLTPPRLARQLVDGIDGARLVTLDDAGHMLPLEEPDALAELLAAAAA
jgi:pimeloyl-ACP methyl ester carboxylesterase